MYVLFIGLHRNKVYSHLKSKTGCPLCTLYGDLTPNEYFLNQVYKIHKNNYEYPDLNFKGNKVKINILCNKCDTLFSMRPNDHISSKQGCPLCHKPQIYTKNYYLANNIPDHFVWLYLVEFSNENEKFLKIGFTKHKNITYRFRGYSSSYVVKVLFYKELMFFSAFDYEQQLLFNFKEYSYKPLIKFKGHTECLQYNQLNNIMSALTEMLSEKTS